MRLTRFFFLATVFAVTFEKVHWSIAGSVSLADVLAIAFLLSFLFDRLGRRDDRFPRTALIVLAFTVAFLVVYLIGFFNLDSSQGEAQFGKGLVKFGIHFLFVVCGIAYLARRSERFYWQTLGVFTAGMVVNACYGVLQLLAARSGSNLDNAVLSPLTGGASSINIYGAVQGANVYRPNALTGDPNHLGIMLLIPLLVLTPVYLRLERSHRLKVPLALCLAFFLLVEAATLSRSGLLGLLVGGLILALPYRRKLLTRELLVPLGAVAAVLLVVFLVRLHYFETILRSRSGVSTGSTHFTVYDFIPQIVRMHPLFGLGLNNFSVYYQLVTGLTNWGPHSFYVALIVETGLVGAIVFAVFLWYLFRRLRASRALGRALEAVGDPVSARVRPVAWGMTAALAGTLASNVFYLTMTFYYFFVFVALLLALPVVFGRRLSQARSLT